jgi:hypothetical protein
LNTLAPQSLFWPLGICLDLERVLSLFLFWTNVDTFLRLEMEWLSFIIFLLWLVMAHCVMVYT